MQGPSVFRFTVSKAEMSNRILCYDCLRELSERTGLDESFLFYKMRPFTYLVRGAWQLFGLLGLVLSVVAIVITQCS